MNEQEIEQLLQQTLQEQGLTPQDLTEEQLNGLREAIANSNIEQVSAVLESVMAAKGGEEESQVPEEQPPVEGPAGNTTPQEVNFEDINMDQQVQQQRGGGMMPPQQDPMAARGGQPPQDPMAAMMGGMQGGQPPAPKPLSDEPKGQYNYQEKEDSGVNFEDLDMDKEVAMTRGGYIPPPEEMNQQEEPEDMLSDEDIMELLDDDETNDDLEPEILKGILNGSKDAELTDKVSEEELAKIKARVKALVYEMEEA